MQAAPPVSRPQLGERNCKARVRIMVQYVLTSSNSSSSRRVARAFLSGHGDKGAETRALAGAQTLPTRGGERSGLRRGAPRAPRPAGCGAGPASDVRGAGAESCPGGRRRESRPGRGIVRGFTPPPGRRLRRRRSLGPRGGSAQPRRASAGPRPGSAARPLPRPSSEPPTCRRGRSPGGIRDVPDEQGGVGGPRVARHDRFLRSLRVCQRPLVSLSLPLPPLPPQELRRPPARPPPLGLSPASAQPQRPAQRGRSAAPAWTHGPGAGAGPARPGDRGNPEDRSVAVPRPCGIRVWRVLECDGIWGGGGGAQCMSGGRKPEGAWGRGRDVGG